MVFTLHMDSADSVFHAASPHYMTGLKTTSTEPVPVNTLETNEVEILHVVSPQL